VEKLLTYKDPEDGLETYYFPITEFYDPKTSSIEDAINFALGKLINKLGIDEKEFFEAGIYRPLYYQLYEIKEDRLPKAANPIPYIFFKINLKKEIPLKAKGGWTYYKWAEKTEVVRQWDEPGIFRQHLSLDEITDDALYEKLGENLFKVINSAFVRRELGYKMLECVDMLIFKKPPKESEEEFFMMYRLNLQGWEYPRGRLHYYETRYEGAFRKIKEETGILPSQIKYCGEIGWQTVDVRVRKEYYDTLRVYALVFYVEEPSALSIKLQASSPKYKWMKLDEIRNSLWKAEQDYNVKFFDMWKDSRDEIFQRAGIK
jgi:ADP-ribose pyrophosphatase YjhB (NUDIX family)